MGEPRHVRQSPSPPRALVPHDRLTFTAGSVLAPDTSLYTTLYPNKTGASYAAFGAIPFSIGGAQPFSYNLLFRLRSFGANLNSGYVHAQTVVLQLTGRDGEKFGVFVSYRERGFVLEVRSENNSLTRELPLETHRWYDLSFTWNGTNAVLYLDGGLEVSAAPFAPRPIQSPVFTLGMNATFPPKPSEGKTDSPFNGDVKRLFVWSTALSAQDVARQMWTPPREPMQAASLLLGYDFTVNPPTPVGSGPRISPVNLGFASESPALLSLGGAVATAGQGTTANPGGGAPFSILAWINTATVAPLSAPSPMDGYVFSNGDATDPKHMGIRLAGGKVVVELGGKTVTSNTVLARNQWQYVGITYDGSTCRIYLNGSPNGSGPISGAGSPSTPAICLWGILRNGQPAATWSGHIQFLSIWDQALTAAQVAQQANEDPTLELSCTANFMLSAYPLVDSIAVRRYGLWDANGFQAGPDIFLDPDIRKWSAQSVDLSEPRRPGLHRVSTERPPTPRLARRLLPTSLSPIQPFSPEHRALMVNELRAALSALEPGEHVDRWLEEYRTEVDRVFDLAVRSPEQLEGPRVSYREVDGQLGLFYHPDARTEIDLEVRVEISQECVAWWISFILTAILGLLGVFGIPTPLDDLTQAAKRIVGDPAVIETLRTVVGLTFTAGTFLSFCRVLYDFGYLTQAIWLAVSKLSWWSVSKFIIYVVGIFAPSPSPQKALFIANAIVTVTRMVIALAGYPSACGSPVATPGEA